MKTAAAVHPSAAIRIRYHKKLDALIAEMEASIVYWLTAAWRKNTPVMATDESPSKSLERTMRGLAQRWQNRFDREAPDLAEEFAKASMRRTTLAMEQSLASADLSINFKLTAAARDALQAITAENVSLIKSIASENLTQVEGILMRSVAQGGDLATMTKDLQARFGVTRRRAKFITRDQNSKATAVVVKVRQTEAGITQAVWLHSSGGREPRPEHVKAGRDRLVYNVAEGALIDGKRIWPGTEIRCRCIARPVVEGFS